jgi:putative toxin-antitoxin system antitoxin component (TIGR02293 family)
MACIVLPDGGINMSAVLKFKDRRDETDLPDIKAFQRRLETGQRGSDHLYATLLGLKILDTKQLLKKIEEGFSYRTIEVFQRNIGLPLNELAELVQIKPRTLSRRKEEGRLLSDESDRLLRAARLFGKTLELFEGDLVAARDWLSSPQLALGGIVPLLLARTELGAREVENVIGRIEQGIFS